MLTIYGAPASRAFRVLWMARELGLAHHSQPIDLFSGEQNGPEYLRVNPLGLIPAMEWDGFSLGESLAITLYLAKRAGSDLGPRTPEEDGEMMQWTLWAATAIEGQLLPIIRNRLLLPPEAADEGEVEATLAALTRPLGRLDAVLARQTWLVGERFTAADLNVAAVLSLLRLARIDTTRFGAPLDRWLTACLTRPACQLGAPPAKITPEQLKRLEEARAGGHST